MCWVLRYYYQGCPSWNWYYPYHYAPFASDFLDVAKMPHDFETGTKPVSIISVMLNYSKPVMSKRKPDFAFEIKKLRSYPNWRLQLGASAIKGLKVDKCRTLGDFAWYPECMSCIGNLETLTSGWQMVADLICQWATTISKDVAKDTLYMYLNTWWCGNLAVAVAANSIAHVFFSYRNLHNMWTCR